MQTIPGWSLRIKSGWSGTKLLFRLQTGRSPLLTEQVLPRASLRGAWPPTVNTGMREELWQARHAHTASLRSIHFRRQNKSWGQARVTTSVARPNPRCRFLSVAFTHNGDSHAVPASRQLRNSPRCASCTQCCLSRRRQALYHIFIILSTGNIAGFLF